LSKKAKHSGEDKGGVILYRIILSWLFVMVIMAPQVSMAATATSNPSASLANVRWQVHKEGADGSSRLRLVIDTTGPVTVTKGVISGSAAPQLVFEIQNAGIGTIDNSIVLDGEIANKVSFVNKNNVSSQVTVDLSQIIEESNYRIFTLPSDVANNKPFRIVIDINKPLPKPSYSFTAGLQGKVIAIDPGHGGADSGAVGSNGTQEKTITLAVAKKVKLLLEKAGAKVVMTRQTDVDVYAPNASAADELQARSNIANTNGADIFVSIHINAFTNPDVGGIATYYFEKSYYDSMLARNIQDNLATVSGFPDRGVNTAGFYVMKHTDMPAVLTELGFISNPEEEQALGNAQFQQQLAQGLVQGLDGFFTQASKKGGGY